MHQPHLSSRGSWSSMAGMRSSRRPTELVRDPQLKGCNRDRLGQRRRCGRVGKRRCRIDGRADRRDQSARRWRSTEGRDRSVARPRFRAESSGFLLADARGRRRCCLPRTRWTTCVPSHSVSLDDELMQTFVRTGAGDAGLRRGPQRSAVRGRRGLPRLQAGAAGWTTRRRPVVERQAVRPRVAGRLAGPHHLVPADFSNVGIDARDSRSDPRLAGQPRR